MNNSNSSRENMINEVTKNDAIGQSNAEFIDTSSRRHLNLEARFDSLFQVLNLLVLLLDVNDVTSDSERRIDVGHERLDGHFLAINHIVVSRHPYLARRVRTHWAHWTH